MRRHCCPCVRVARRDRSCCDELSFPAFNREIKAFVAGMFAWRATRWCTTRWRSRRIFAILFGVFSCKCFAFDALETLQRRVTLNERTVNREVIVARKPGILRLLHDAIEKSRDESMLCKSVSIFCEDSRIKGLIVC